MEVKPYAVIQDIATETLDELFACQNRDVVIDGWRFVDISRDSDSRWESHWFVVITQDGETFWQGHIARGLTEYQEGGDSPKTTAIMRVEPVEVTVTEYKPWLSTT